MDVGELIARPLQAMEKLRADLPDIDTGGDAMARAVEEMLCSGTSPSLNGVPTLSRKALTQGKLAANSLVRYRGMVQDQYEPEYFVGSFEEVEAATGRRSKRQVKYADIIDQRPGFVNDYEGPAARTMERLPCFCVPVPGQSPWARSREEVSSPTAKTQELGAGPPKRQRDGGPDSMDCEMDGQSACPEALQRGSPASRRKNPRALDVATSSGASCSRGQRGCSTASDQDAAAAAFEHQQELDLEGLPCLIKMYDVKEGQLKLNDTAEFVGVLAYDPSPPPEDSSASAAASANGGIPDPFRGLESFARKLPPPSLVPRLHCIFHRVLSPAVELGVDPKDPRSALYALQGPLPFGTFMREAKRQAVEHLAHHLRGDVLAAEYALLTLLSRVYVRTEAMAPGSLSLNLCQLSAAEACELHDAVAQLAPRTVRVPLTTESLSQKFKFAPKKDYEADRLMLSSLQLSEGTVVILDETGLEPGEIGQEGVSNLEALNSLVTLQKVPYDFGFYRISFEVDHPVITVSSGRSVVSNTASVPVVSCEPHADRGGRWRDGAAGTGPLPDRLRVYVQATRLTELSLDKMASALAEEDFVRARREGQEVTAEDFHRWITVARLTALSLGDETVTASHWEHMKDLEARVAQRRKNAGPGEGDKMRPTGSTPAPACAPSLSTMSEGQ